MASQESFIRVKQSEALGNIRGYVLRHEQRLWTRRYTLETWKQLSEGSLRAAEILFRGGEYRSCVSRAYYAAYCAATGEIVKKLTTFPNAWNNPPHVKVPMYVQNNLTMVQAKKQRTISRINILRLYRENADYRPQTAVSEQVARNCLRAAAAIQRDFWGGTI